VSSRDALDGIDEISAIVSFGNPHEDGLDDVPSLAHVSGKAPDDIPPQGKRKAYFYPEAELLFVLPASSSYRPSSAAVAHTRTLTFLKPLLGGPYFDLEAIWEEHTKFEFADRSVEATMASISRCSPNPTCTAAPPKFSMPNTFIGLLCTNA